MLLVFYFFASNIFSRNYRIFYFQRTRFFNGLLAPNTPWWLVGALGVLTGFVILSYYSVIGGWSIHYIVESVTGLTPEMNYPEIFNQHITQVGIPIFYHAIFMAICVSIIASGVVNGIQKAVKTLMPILFILLVVLIFRSLTLEGAGEGLAYYLSPDWGAVTAGTLSSAVGQAFFTLSLGMGAIITYGSYLSQEDNIGDNAAYVVGLDTLIAVMAGFAIFPAVFALGLDPATGPGLTFVTLPAVFGEMPLGSFFGFLFFLLLTIAAVTSAISLLEVVTAWLVDEKRWDRAKAAVTLGIIIFLVGIPPVLGYSAWAGFTDVNPLGMDILDTYDFFADTVFLPLGGLLTAIFVGYVYKAQNVVDEANRVEGKIKIGSWYGFLIRYVIPVAIAIVLVIGIYEGLAG
ncbi:sodium-dependent transporter [Halarsenatibacter silvermanii]|uniref:Neurotransmitter:Na+ symporter, NSS family n=1 Tax=Halarsenatibacter silvermanii TaxID=321763 RepID=A0A1G9QJT4_9FIRM|nr:sodium-dependent transporter [Halarsenatibacter silvermanii]SDM11160.1 neurotransmitter:Na+ symporter, NSS family [Halarsenatibacter silvermanii]